MEELAGVLLALFGTWALLPDIWLRRRSCRALGSGRRAGGRIALTFDDGPDPRVTPLVLDLLARQGVSATFFLVARKAREHPDLVRAIVREGHEVGSHGMNHLPFWLLPPGRTRFEIKEAAECLRKLTGQPVRCFRPPWGSFNLAAPFYAEQEAQKIVLWTLDSCDWFFLTPGRLILNRVLRQVREGSVILFHDGRGAGRTGTALLEALPLLLEKLLERGFLPVSVGELLNLRKGEGEG
ncbi:MAG: polysaccharide deacetylase family protein [Firmicutes bacterium]|nr:polysaccharide deacetylase family protein [Bacillota bacterium]